MKHSSFSLIRIGSLSLASVVFCSAVAFAAPAPSAPESNAAVSAPGSGNVGNKKSFDLNEQGVKAQLEGRTEQAEGFFRRAVAIDPRNLTAAFNLASVLVIHNKTPEAISLLEGYVKEFDQDPGLFSRLGDSYFAEKKLDPALKSYQRAFALDPHYPRLTNRLATIYGLRNNSKEAEKYLALSVEHDPRDFEGLASYGSILLFNGKVDQSIQATKRSLQIKPTSGAYITLGTAYEARGDFGNSLISFQRARDLGDTRKELSERIAGLEKKVAKSKQPGTTNSASNTI